MDLVGFPFSWSEVGYLEVVNLPMLKVGGATC